MIGIYKITNPDGEIYIGQSLDINRRFKHYVDFKCSKQPLIYASLKKYGWFNHVFEIIEECIDKQLDEREEYWIKTLNSTLNILSTKNAKEIKSNRLKQLWSENKFNRTLGKRIQNLETGEIYNSCTEAYQKLNIHPSYISKLCKRGEKLKYVDNWKIRPSKK
jgi:group I intron endonuclease